MYEGDAQSILRCEQCHKPFDKQSTLKRHGYYCRSRRSGSTSQNRSCISCARGKKRCDNRRPDCSRCITKAIQCHYPVNTQRGRAPYIQQSHDTTTERDELAPISVEKDREAASHVETALEGVSVVSNPEFENLPNWDCPDFDFVNFADVQVNDEIIQHSSSGSSLLDDQLTPLAPSSNQIDHARHALYSNYISIPESPTSNLRSLIQRPKMKTRGIATLILHTLKAYPQMIMRYNTLPPFINPCLISTDDDNSNMEPLTNSISLVKMISGGVQASRRLFWKNVRFECERLCEDHLKMNTWELLAAMQALILYILVRLDEGETDHNNLDFLMIETVTALAIQANQIARTPSTQSMLYNYSLENRWKDLIFEESTRRLCVVYQIINMLVYFEPAEICNMPINLILAPLPTRRQLWEASNEFTWMAEWQKEPCSSAYFGLAANGDLVQLDNGQQYCGGNIPAYESPDSTTRSTENWTEWCSGIDGFGGLVMLAASLIA